MYELGVVAPTTIQALRCLWKDNGYNFEASLDGTVSSRPIWATEKDPISKWEQERKKTRASLLSGARIRSEEAYFMR